MAFIVWTEELQVYKNNVKSIDAQHKKLIDIVNDLHDNMKLGKGREVMDDILKRLIDYTVYHFGTEKSVWTKHNYPGGPSHDAEHIKLTNDVLAFQARFNKSEVMVSVDIMNFLKDWLTNHILKTDKEFGLFLAKKGITQE